MSQVLSQIDAILHSDVFVAFFVFALLLGLVYWALNHIRPDAVKPRRFSEKPWLNALTWFGVLLSPIMALLFVQVLWLLFRVIATFGDQLAPGLETEQAQDLRWHALAIVGLLTALGGLLGTPFAFIRVHSTERQTTAQEQGLITDRINKAVENLGATRTLRDADGNEDHAPNLEVRIGAIYALERIAQDSLRDHVQIMEILTAYVRENAKAEDAEDSPRARWRAAYNDPELKNREDATKAAYAHQETDLTDATSLEAIRDWARSLKCRTDTQAALTVIGRRSVIQIERETADKRQSDKGYRLDLSATNLQGIVLSNLEFSRANLIGARLEGATLVKSHLEHATLFGVHMEGANLRETHLERATLIGANLEGADFFKAHLEGVDLFNALLEGTELIGAHLEGAILIGAHHNQATDFREAVMTRAAVKGVDLSNSSLSSEQIKSMFGDGSVILPDNQRPTQWPDKKLDWTGFFTEWRLYKSDPTTYRPPQDRPDPGPS